MELLNPKICQDRESYEKEEGMMTEKYIYCSLCYSQVEQIGKPGWVGVLPYPWDGKSRTGSIVRRHTEDLSRGKTLLKKTSLLKRGHGYDCTRFLLIEVQKKRSRTVLSRS